MHLLCTLYFMAVTWYVVSGRQNTLEVLYKWKTIDFDFHDPETREQLIQSGQFKPGNALPFEANPYLMENDERIFVALPKFLEATPVTLATISSKKEEGEYLLRPYPDLEANEVGNCEAMQSVFRTVVDDCHRLWAVDCGLVEMFTTNRQVCPPKIVAFSLTTNKKVLQYEFPESVLKSESQLNALAVDVRDNGSSTFVYVADVGAYGLVVYHVEHSRSWRVEHPSFYPYPPYTEFLVQGVNFQLLDGIIGITLEPYNNNNNDRRCFYHSFASVRESWVYSSIIRNESNFVNGTNLARREFKTSAEARPGQGTSESFDRNGNMFFSVVPKNNLMCWTHGRSFTRNNLHEVIRDDQNIDFVTGLKVVTNRKNKEDEVWMLSNRLQIAIVNRSYNPHEINFKVIRGRVKSLLPTGKCGRQNFFEFDDQS